MSERKYMILSARDERELAKEVESYIQRGWCTVGGVAAAASGAFFRLYQAVIHCTENNKNV